MAGRYRRHNIQLGSFEPPAYFDVPILMKDWEDDLATRRMHDHSIQQHQLPIVDFRQTERKEFITAVKIATANGSLDQLIKLLK